MHPSYPLPKKTFIKFAETQNKPTEIGQTIKLIKVIVLSIVSLILTLFFSKSAQRYVTRGSTTTDSDVIKDISME